MSNRWIRVAGMFALVILLSVGAYLVLRPNAHPTILFARVKGDLVGIYTRDLTTSEEKQLIADPSWKLGYPIWSPKGDKIVFALSSPYSPDFLPGIYSINPDGSDIHYLFGYNDGNPYASLSWSPDGKKIVFAASGDKFGFPRNIYTVNVDGSDLQQLTASKPIEENNDPDWSPDGQRIVFTSVRGPEIWSADKDLYIMNADGSNQHLLTSGSGSHEENPKWSPDGQKIVFTSYSYSIGDSGSSIFVLNIDDPTHWQSVIQKSNDEDFESNTSPDWSPNGQQIVFVQFQSKYSNLYTVNIDGTNLTEITFEDDSAYRDFVYHPSWRP